jgi:hypothetical protein
MKYLIAGIAASLSFFSALDALADQASFRYGLGITNAPTSQIKNFGFRYEENQGLFDIHTAAEAGLWTDTGKAQGRAGSAYGQVQMGVRPESEHIYAKVFWGAALLSNKDSQLGGRTQFVQDLGFGFQGKGSFVGLQYKHISSAGIHKPNKGRDFVGAELGVKF